MQEKKEGRWCLLRQSITLCNGRFVEVQIKLGFKHYSRCVNGSVASGYSVSDSVHRACVALQEDIPNLRKRLTTVKSGEGASA